MATIAQLCRDCFADFSAEKILLACPKCGSPRMLAHEELTSLQISHIDCDAFYASVEKRDNPDLIDKPVIIGGGQRGVVATCCYIARINGVRSAMPMSVARRNCPNAVIIKPNMAKYVTASRQIRKLMDTLSPLVEPLSIDEAFVDLSGTQTLHKAYPAKVLAKFAKRVEDEIGVTVSIGLSHNKFLAKIASDLDKPRGIALIGEAETISLLAPKPISIIYGVGQVLTEKLKRDGLLTIGQLQTHDPDQLMRRYGETGLRLSRLARGIDTRRLKPGRAAKSISSETTFRKDLSTFDSLAERLLNLCERVSERLKKKSISGDTITLKLKTIGFKSRTRARQLSIPTQLAHVIYETAADLLAREVDGTKFRLIGIGVSRLEAAADHDPVDLIEPMVARKAAVERAMDKVRGKFGPDAVVRGKLYRQKRTNSIITSDSNNNSDKSRAPK